MRFGAAVDMAKSMDEIKEETAPTPQAVPVYSWRHCFSLDKEDLEKLGMDMPERGDIVRFIVTGKVTSVSESEREDAAGTVSEHACVEIQITKFQPEVDEVTEVAEEAKERRGRFYDKVDSDAA
jgi:hypothetical protein